MKKAFYYIVLIFVALIFNACTVLAPKSDPSVFYMMTPETDGKSFDYDQANLVIMPVLIPSYLDRPQIIQKSEKHQLVFSEYSRWAEPFGEGVTRIIRENMAALFGAQKIRQFPYHGDRSQDKKLYLRTTISQFESDTAGNVILKSSWRVTDHRNVKVYYSGETDIKRNTDSGDKNAIVISMSECLGELCIKVAEEVCLKE